MGNPQMNARRRAAGVERRTPSPRPGPTPWILRKPSYRLAFRHDRIFSVDASTAKQSMLRQPCLHQRRQMESALGARGGEIPPRDSSIVRDESAHLLIAALRQTWPHVTLGRASECATRPVFPYKRTSRLLTANPRAPSSYNARGRQSGI